LGFQQYLLPFLSFVNADDIVAHIHKAFRVHVEVVQFNTTAHETIDLMQRTAVLIGNHGAGLTNVLFMRPGAALLQLVPYGWEYEPGKIIRGEFYENWAEAAQARGFSTLCPQAILSFGAGMMMGIQSFWSWRAHGFAGEIFSVGQPTSRACAL
jgi:Glycosyltransferase 61